MSRGALAAAYRRTVPRPPEFFRYLSLRVSPDTRELR